MSSAVPASTKDDEPDRKQAQSTAKSAVDSRRDKIVDSWEDENVADSWEDEANEQTPSVTIPATHNQDATEYKSPYELAEASSRSRFDDTEAQRPEKSTAVASRLIAAGLGVKAQRTPDQRKYDMAVRKQAREQKEREIQARKRREEELEAARQAIWED